MSKLIDSLKKSLTSAFSKLKDVYDGMRHCTPEFKLDAEHFQDASDEMVDFMWGEAKETISALESSYRTNKENSSKLLNLLLAGVGGSALMFINSLQQSHFYFGFVVIVVGWTACSLLLIQMCIESNRRVLGSRSPEDVYINDPNLPKKLPLPRVKRYILVNMSRAIQVLEFDVGRIGKNLDRIRRASAYVAVLAIAVESVHFIVF